MSYRMYFTLLTLALNCMYIYFMSLPWISWWFETPDDSNRPQKTNFNSKNFQNVQHWEEGKHSNSTIVDTRYVIVVHQSKIILFVENNEWYALSTSQWFCVFFFSRIYAFMFSNLFQGYSWMTIITSAPICRMLVLLYSKLYRMRLKMLKSPKKKILQNIHTIRLQFSLRATYFKLHSVNKLILSAIQAKKNTSRSGEIAKLLLKLLSLFAFDKKETIRLWRTILNNDFVCSNSKS